MGALDTIITLVVIIAFVIIIGSKIYASNKEGIDMMIEKIKGWFIKDDGDGEIGPDDDFELAFRGQLLDY